MRFYLYLITRYLFLDSHICLNPEYDDGHNATQSHGIGADSTRISASDSTYGKDDVIADVDTMNTGLTSVNTVDSASGEQSLDMQPSRDTLEVTFSLFSETHDCLHVDLAISPNSGLSSDEMRAHFYQARGLDKIPYIATVGP